MSQKNSSDTMGLGCLLFFIGAAISGILGTGFGLIFLSPFQAIGVGLISTILGGFVLGFTSWIFLK